MLDLINEIWQTMSTNKLRTALTGMAVAWGIFMLIMLVGMAKGVSNSFSSSEFAKTSNVIMLWPGRASKPYKGLKEGRWIPLKERNLKEIEHDNPGKVLMAAPSVDGQSTIMSTERDYVSRSYSGVYPEAREQLVIDYGRFINEKDLAEQRKSIVLDYKTAEQLYADPTKAVGKSLNVGGVAFNVVGVYDHEWKTDIFIPYTTARALAGYNDDLGMIRVVTGNLKSEEDAETLEKSIRATLGRSNSHAADDNSAIWVWNRFESYLANQKVMNILNIVMWVIGLLTLITGIVGVSNIMFVSVRERTHEIGVRRAIGAKPRNILAQVIVESVSLTTIFGYIGILLGTVGTEILAHVFAGSDFIKDPTVNLSLAMQVTCVLIVSGALAGIFPAMRALKVRPVEALRTE